MMQTFPNDFTYSNYKYVQPVQPVQLTEDEKQENLICKSRQIFYDNVLSSKSWNDNRPHLQFDSDLSEDSKSKIMKEIYERFPNIEVQVKNEIMTYNPKNSYHGCCAIYVYLD